MGKIDRHKNIKSYRNNNVQLPQLINLSLMLPFNNLVQTQYYILHFGQ